MVWCLQISCRFNTKLLSPNTIYTANLIFRLENRAFGLDAAPLEVEIRFGSYRTRRTISITGKHCQGRDAVARGDGWMELKLGEFFVNGNEDDTQVKMELKEIEGTHLKGGIVLQGIELRPNAPIQ
ncbi:F-box protein PP2-B13-like [Andrographis paniculata]|uniref:F-box protein PP2-B13-like n=1 Tax=Andrographis paniculata TaxID=175694 RepID=UPI0021E762F5|nr:F-box protein PP2-B13-like [Andrographis paniculata]